MAWLRGLLRELAGQGRAVLLSSHVLSEVEQTVDRVAIVHEGRLRYAGPLDGLSGSLESAFLDITGTR
jgi:ABC-2 type transport system ATP-binding protein